MYPCNYLFVLPSCSPNVCGGFGEGGNFSLSNEGANLTFLHTVQFCGQYNIILQVDKENKVFVHFYDQYSGITVFGNIVALTSYPVHPWPVGFSTGGELLGNR